MRTAPATARTSPNGPRPHGEVREPWERFGWVVAIVWLAFLYFPARSLLVSEAPMAAIVVGWVAVVLFGVGYTSGFVLGMRAGWGSTSTVVTVLFLVMIGLSAATIPAIGWGVLSFLPFIMSFASYGMQGLWHPMVTTGSVVVALLALVVSDRHPNAISMSLVVALMAVVNGANVWLITRSVRGEQLKLDLATSRERETVARDVHDLIGHTLTVVKLKSELAAKLVERDPERAKQEIEAIAELTQEAISGVRGTVTGLRASAFAEQLAASREALSSAGLEVRTEGEPGTLSPAQAIPASWVLREATTNILRHAKASSAVIQVEPGTMLISDDGRGRGRPVGSGIAGMRERAAAAGAELDVDDAPGGGTLVRLRW